MISKELVAASTEPLILSLLSKGESYGYALIQEVKMLSGDRIEWTDGMLYPVLHRMEENGWIKSRWVEIENGRKRKYYALKKDGHYVLNGSISTDLQKGDQDRHFPCRGALGGTLRHWLRHFRAAAFRDRGSIWVDNVSYHSGWVSSDDCIGHDDYWPGDERTRPATPGNGWPDTVPT